MTKLLRAALAYPARLGWPVFPLIRRGKLPLISEDEGGHGHLDATTDAGIIQEWWRLQPNANIGIACDERSGLLVLDVDPRSHGDEALADLEAQHGELPRTPTGLTGGGGLHLVFRRPEGVNFRGKLAGGIDVKASGYIVAPPSVHPDGPLYRWDAGAHPLETPVAELPSWVLERILSFEPDGIYGQPADDAAKSFLARSFAHAGWLGSRIDSVRINCRCPWEDQHTQKSGSGGTVIFAPKQGSGAGWFHCAHESHGRKSMREVLDALPIEARRLAAGDLAQYAVDEAVADLEEREAIEAEGNGLL